MVLTPLDLLARIEALVPPPRYPLVRYHGVLAPRSSWRRLVVHGRREPRPCPASPRAFTSPSSSICRVLQPRLHGGGEPPGLRERVLRSVADPFAGLDLARPLGHARWSLAAPVRSTRGLCARASVRAADDDRCGHSPPACATADRGPAQAAAFATNANPAATAREKHGRCRRARRRARVAGLCLDAAHTRNRDALSRAPDGRNLERAARHVRGHRDVALGRRGRDTHARVGRPDAPRLRALVVVSILPVRAVEGRRAVATDDPWR